MYKYDKYARPYCENCKLIWGKKSTGLVMVCNKCGSKLALKSFNPWPTFVMGLGIISLGVLTIISGLPIIWIGGFLWGGQKIYNAFKQWSDVQDLDNK
ncbi:MAG: hypothetical protein ABH819_00685 [Patescibacteria group bacterium]